MALLGGQLCDNTPDSLRLTAFLPIVIAISSLLNLESFFFVCTLSNFWLINKPTVPTIKSIYLIMNCSILVLVDNSLHGICSVLNMISDFVVGFLIIIQMRLV